jgi:hypothetical protein
MRISIISYGKNSLDLRPTWVTTSPRERIEFVSQESTVCGFSHSLWTDILLHEASKEKLKQFKLFSLNDLRKLRSFRRNSDIHRMKIPGFWNITPCRLVFRDSNGTDWFLFRIYGCSLNWRGYNCILEQCSWYKDWLRAGLSGVWIPAGVMFFPPKSTKPVLGPSQPPIQWGSLFFQG